MTRQQATSTAVVAAWAVGNALLAVLLIGFGESVFAIALFAAATALPALLALAVARAPARNPDAEREFEVAGGAVWAVVAALGIVLIGIGVIYGIWFIIIGALAGLFAGARLAGLPRRAERRAGDARR